MKSYDHKKLEKKWQKEWATKKPYKSKEGKTKGKKTFILDMFPYPSGEGLHVGHPKGYIATDIYSRFSRMQGKSVLHPMGWDAFGLPAENYAIKNKIHPRVAVQKNIKNFKSQLANLGFDYDWSREINTTDPEYYKWTQWIFLKLYEHGLAFQSNEPINWCPSCQTGLANEDLDGSVCERCGTQVEKKSLPQWVLKITDYADRMLEDLDTLQWPDHIKEQQRNWIGKSEGAEVDFKLDLPAPSGDMYFEGTTRDLQATRAEILKAGLKISLWPKEVGADDRAVVEKTKKGYRLTPPGGRFPFERTSVADLFSAYITVFTTRPDTLYGATYLVLAPEHPWVQLATDIAHEGVLTNAKDVRAYVRKAAAKSEIERTGEGKEKTGVLLEGVMAINPATKEKIPMYVADYVLGAYGTGAIMAVPAHDQRDFDFAHKFDIEIRPVVAPHVIDAKNPPRSDKKTVERRMVHSLIRDPKTGKYLVLKWKKQPWTTFVVGGVDEGESLEVAARREIAEEVGYTDLSFKRIIMPPVYSEYFAAHKDENRFASASGVVFELTSEAQIAISAEEEAKHEPHWMTLSDLENDPQFTCAEFVVWKHMLDHDRPYTGPGKLVNSGRFDRLLSDEAGPAIAESVGGRAKTTYKLKDWVFSRQRYWGEPIPMIHCPSCGVVPVPYKDLPVKLPEVKNYAPTGTGESPLAAIEKWVNVKCPKCKGKAKRETNTMPQWAGSSWYYLRFMDPKNKKALVDPKKEKYWAPVNVYVGGDHAVRHLIYARFWHKFLYDIKSVSTIEPFARLEFLGFILAEDGRKMSKRYGNVINPDDIVKLYGADSMRVYEMFMGPFTDTIAWNTNSMIGARRFIERVWRLQDHLVAKEDEATNRVLHQTIKKVGEDIESFKFNTGVSQMMIFVNSAEKSGVTKKQYEAFLRVLAPFAPHMTEEIWRALGNKKSVHLAEWPVYDTKKLVADTVTLAVQINGKSRTTIDISPNADEATAKEAALQAAAKWLEGMTIKRFIYVPGRIASFVV